MKISYAITVCNEHEELDRLLRQLAYYVREVDEIVVQCDQDNTTREVLEVLEKCSRKIKVTHFPLAGDFASFKNALKAQCSGDWIFQIDADEYLNVNLLYNLPLILETNPAVEVFIVPRINTVDGLTEAHINKWGWRLNEAGWVNFPDYQTRILQNSPKIQWTNKVHELLTGYSTFVVLPAEESYCLYHPKGITRQEKQNNFYSTL